MKNTVIVSLLILAFSTTAQAQETEAALATTRQAVHDFFVYDAQAFGEAFTEDAWLVNPFGMRMDGQESIINTHAEVFEYWKTQQTSEAQIETEQIDVLGDDAYVVSMVVHIQHYSKAGEPIEKMSAALLTTMTRESEGWKINQMQITPITSPEQG